MPNLKKIKITAGVFLLIILSLITSCSKETKEVAVNTVEIADSSFAVVELFTSLGCPTCPSAEKEINHLLDKARQLKMPLFILTYHVDYWNRKEWRDPYSLAESSNRQRMYAGVLHTKNIYTPQTVLNGITEFSLLGSMQYMDSITQILKKTPPKRQRIRAQIARIADSLRISITLGAKNPREQLIIAMTQRSGQPVITNGENSGKKIKCVNIVRYLAEIPCINRQLQHTFKIPSGLLSQPSDIVFLTQNRLTGRISGAYKTVFVTNASLTRL